MISRDKMHEEFILRETIQKSLKNRLSSRVQEKKKRLIEEISLRSVIQGIISEAEQDPNSDPHPSTGINFLKVLFKNTGFLSALEEEYKALTSTEDQRESFVSHVIKAIQSTMNRLDGLDDSEQMNEVEIEIDDEDQGPPGYVSRERESKSEKEDKEKEDFTIEDTDETGRNRAFETYKKIEKYLIDQYVSMGDSSDRSVFKKYIVLNLEHYFEEWSQEAPVGDSPAEESPGPIDPTPPVDDDVADMDIPDAL